MANPTTNYGFVLPTPTDLVTDLPADFDVALQGVDTQMLTNANAATEKATLTTKGDIYAATAASTVSRLAVGTNGQVLTADSSQATGLKYAAPAAAAFNGASATKSTTQSILAATFTALTFNTENYDTNAYHDNTTNNTRFTVPTTGYYLLTLAAATNTASQFSSAAIQKNGTLIQKLISAQAGVGVTFTGTFAATAGDYFEFVVFSAGTFNIIGDDSNTKPTVGAIQFVGG